MAITNEGIRYSINCPYLDAIIAFQAAAVGLIGVYTDQYDPHFKESDNFELKGAIVGSLHEHAAEARIRARAEGKSIDNITNLLCCSLANLAYERVKEMNDKSPEFEFFRHVRNACSHNNRFYFETRKKKSEPIREASWRGFTIDHNSKGKSNPLYGQQCFGYRLGPADLMMLLHDIDQKTTIRQISA
jgi:hypothetical protein